MSSEFVLKPFPAQVDLQIDYRGDLNEEQHAAVTAGAGPSLVIAGAGSGKTRTLTYRVAYLLEHGVPADRILLLTFTNKAAREMMRRVAELLEMDRPPLWGGTFHSIGARILRSQAAALGYRPDFTILDREDSTALLKACLADAEIVPGGERFPQADVLGDIFSMAANTLKPIAEVVAQFHEHFTTLTPAIEDLAGRYATRKRACNVMDFDDLLARWLELLASHPDVAEVYQRRFQFILVDEYQDTNRLQSEIIDRLAVRHRNVMVVGDDSQSIYSWRGANFRNILEFPKRYPGAAVFKIETNYRSTPEILSLANAAIAANVDQFSKTLTPARPPGGKPHLIACHDARIQATFIAQRAAQLHEEGMAWSQMAVLYRSHFHALEVQLQLARYGIPFSITSGIRFFEQAHIKDVSAYLRLIVNPDDEIAFKRVVQLLPGIGERGAAKLWQAFHERWIERGAAAWNPEGGDGDGDGGSGETAGAAIATTMQQCSKAVPKKAATHWAELSITFSQMEAESIRNRPSELIRHILEAGYETHLQETFANHRQRNDDLEQLAGFASEFEGLEEFLTQLSLLANVETEETQARGRDDDQMRLSTIHQAKGLEFDVVFVIMLCDGLFPSSRSLESRDGEEEERRLFYVAITRARNDLYLCHPLIRALGGNQGERLQEPSRFLRELPGKLLVQCELDGISPFA